MTGAVGACDGPIITCKSISKFPHNVASDTQNNDFRRGYLKPVFGIDFSDSTNWKAIFNEINSKSGKALKIAELTKVR